MRSDTLATPRTALVTGAGKGIGRAIALALAESGAKVVAISRTLADVDRVVEEIRQRGGTALALAADVAQAADVASAVAAATAELGPIDILVNNAGHNSLGRLDEQDATEWWDQVAVSLGGTYNFSRAVIPSMVARRWGRVINVASISGKQGVKFCTAYCSAKHAVIGFTRALALEVAEDGVTVNAICPGFVETELTDRTSQQRSELFGQPLAAIRQGAVDRNPQRSIMSPDEVVPAVLFFASEASARTTGEAMNISGGSVMH